MSLSGQIDINVGLPNESTGSDSLYTAFTKTQTNFDTLFTNASPYTTFTAGNGASVTANSSTGTVTITNTGVTNLVAGTNITVSSANGNVTISSTGGNGNSGVTSVGLEPVSNARLSVSGSPIVSSGTMYVDLVASNVTAGTYTNPTVVVDTYGRITSASNNTVSGTVTSVGLSPGSGIQINGGPITSSGNITVTNTGVTRINAGTGITVSGANGNVTIAASATYGTVTSIGISSTQLVVGSTPITTAGTITVDLPANVAFSGYANIGTFLKLIPGTAPGTPAEGMVYYDSASHVLKCYNGTAWKTITMT